MKNSVFVSIAIVAGCLLLCVSILYSAHTITVCLDELLYSVNGLRDNPTNNSEEYGDFMSIYIAAAYLKIDVDELNSLLESGELDGTYFKTNENNGGYSITFIREKLYSWCLERSLRLTD